MPGSFQSKKQTFHQIDIHYAEWGQAGRPTMVLLHGVTGHARMWDHIAEHFQDRYRVLAVDQRGHGDSGWSPQQAYETDDLAADLRGLFSTLGLKDVILIGLSWGGLSALVHTAAHPETVERLVLVDVGLEFSQSESDVPPRPRQFESIQAVVDWERANSAFPALWTLRHFARQSVREQDGVWVRKHDPLFFTRWPFRNRDYWREGRALAVPTWLMHGKDSFVLSADLAQRTVEAIPDARLVEIPDASHLIPLDNPPAFLSAVEAILKA